MNCALYNKVLTLPSVAPSVGASFYFKIDIPQTCFMFYCLIFVSFVPFFVLRSPPHCFALSMIILYTLSFRTHAQPQLKILLEWVERVGGWLVGYGWQAGRKDE